MSQTFTLQSKSSILSSNIYPPLKLESDYCLGLVGLYTYNSIPNVDLDGNKFFYNLYGNRTKPLRSITIPIGSYEIRDIEKYLQEQIILQNDEFSHFNKLPAERKDEEIERIFSLKANNNTLRCEIESSMIDVHFDQERSLGKLLGFSRKVLESGSKHESDRPVEIVKVQIVRVKCNIVQGAFTEDSMESHVLFEFPISVDPGYAINIEPRNIIYLPVNTNLIQNITVHLQDQNGDLVNFRGERIIVRLELKRCP